MGESERSNAGLQRGLRVKRALAQRTSLIARLKLDEFWRTPRLGWALLIAAAFVFAATMLASWTRQQPLAAIGRTMTETRIVRVPFSVEDTATTVKVRELARQRTPRVYVAEALALAEIENSLLTLPALLAPAASLEQVDPKLRETFALTPEAFAEVRAELVEGQASTAWTERVRRFTLDLQRSPILDAATFQRENQEGLNQQLRLILPPPARPGAEGAPPPSVLVPRRNALSAGDVPALRSELDAMARQAGFGPGSRWAVVARLTTTPLATYRFDETATTTDQNAAAGMIPTVVTEVPAGQVIFRRGDVLTQAQAELFAAALSKAADAEAMLQYWLRRLGIAAVIAGVTLAIGGYVALFVPRIRRNPLRMVGVAGLLLGTLALACVSTAMAPGFAALTVVAPTVLTAVVLAIAYDQRVALAFSTLHGILVCTALDQDIGAYAVLTTGIATAIWPLREIRDRNTFLRLSLVAGVGLAAATFLVGLFERPLDSGTLIRVLRELLVDAGLAASGALVIGGFTLFLLPTIERIFDVTTGLTLIELRDPKQPLLRELQQRAPGTYNHSLTVASIAEAAAEAVNANTLLAYVGALYHDIGKMNKPEYFVENRSGGPNKHDKLSPAMSLLIIVAHVKDGLELAREFDLPRSLRHFIESHHGTTLVEYFYHRARQQALRAAAQQRAESDNDELTEGARAPHHSQPPHDHPSDQPEEHADLPDEVEYRYPGPKPQTKEAAILMIADAVESATRTLAEPTPARIEALVQEIASRRLNDGQFDECDMTLRDLHAITESIARTLAAIYHGRVVYPTTSGPTTVPAPTASAGSPQSGR
ncbi:MAG: HDIG domain-containing protein [Planctomycetota bacterium]|nr:HDIG domain-containing protein [Planctomycetota bacterium]